MPALNEIKETFAFLDGWEDRFQYLIDLGKAVEPMPEHEHVEGCRVHGCQSNVWLVADWDENGKLKVRANSDAFIVSGLIALVMALYNSGMTAQQVLDLDPEPVLKELGLESHLSPTRRNGLHAMLERIRSLAAERLANKD